MRPMAVVGMGRIGRALEHTHPKPTLVSGRAALATRDLGELLGPAEIVVHAAGPAGEAVCLKDPGAAFGLHYTLTERLMTWTRERNTRTLILLSTVAPNVGFYGPLKRAAAKLAQRIALTNHDVDQLTVIEAGHVIGEGMSVHESPGVVARFIAAALTHGAIRVPGPGVTIRFTPLRDLLATVHDVAYVPAVRPIALAPVSIPIEVREVAQTVAKLVSLMYQREPASIREDSALSQSPSYEDPLGDIVPVKPLAETLMTWLRTTEVKMLFRGPGGRVLGEG